MLCIIGRDDHVGRSDTKEVNAMNEDRYKRMVFNAFRTEFDLEVREIPETSQKSPDFEVSDRQGHTAIIELKTLESRKASEAQGWQVTRLPNGMSEATRKNNSVSRLAEKIGEAEKQVRTYTVPRGVVILNWDSRVNISHLEELYQGCRVYANAEASYRNTAAARVTNGRFKNVRSDIDFFVWLEGDAREWFFRYVTVRGIDALNRLFGMPPPTL